MEWGLLWISKVFATLVNMFSVLCPYLVCLLEEQEEPAPADLVRKEPVKRRHLSLSDLIKLRSSNGKRMFSL